MISARMDRLYHVDTTYSQKIDLKWQHSCYCVSLVSARPVAQCWTSIKKGRNGVGDGCISCSRIDYGDHYSWILIIAEQSQFGRSKYSTDWIFCFIIIHFVFDLKLYEYYYATTVNSKEMVIVLAFLVSMFHSSA